MDKKLILLVDDEAINIELLVDILEEEYNIKIATSGEVALKVAFKFRPDLIILDVNMPKMTGYEVLEVLKSDVETKNIPVMFLTARSEEESIEKGLNLGAIDFITKPFNLNELLLKVNNYLQ